VLADVRLSGAALETLAAGNMHLRADQVASRTVETPRPVPATAPENSWPGIKADGCGSCPVIPVVDVEVGSANAGGLHADQHFAGAGRGDRHFAQFDAVRGFGLDDGLHGGWHTLEPPHETPDKQAYQPARLWVASVEP